MTVEPCAFMVDAEFVWPQVDPSVHPVQVQDTTVLHAVSIATALLAGCSPVTGDYESSLSLAALLPILLPMQRSEVTRTLCAPLATGLRWSIFHPYSP